MFRRTMMAFMLLGAIALGNGGGNGFAGTEGSGGVTAPAQFEGTGTRGGFTNSGLLANGTGTRGGFINSGLLADGTGTRGGFINSGLLADGTGAGNGFAPTPTDQGTDVGHG
jgi:hypothetical protein